MSAVLRALGPAQRAMLHHLATGDGTWHRADPWRPSRTASPSRSIQTADSLADRGLVERTVRHEPGGTYTVWKITDAGREAIGFSVQH